MKGSSSSSDNQTPTKCFSGILCGFLCTGSLPTHPSDQFNIESNNTQIDCRNAGKSSESDANHVNKQAAALSKPGVVARLMGLDSLPVSPLPSRQKTLGSYFRSRSVNSIDFLSQFDPVKQACHRRHRRVRTSVSFREFPSSLFVLDDKFGVVFPLEEVDETAACEEDQLKVKKWRPGKGEDQQFAPSLRRRILLIGRESAAPLTDEFLYMYTPSLVPATTRETALHIPAEAEPPSPKFL